MAQVKLTEIKDELKSIKNEIQTTGIVCIEGNCQHYMNKILTQVQKLVEVIDSGYIKVDSIKKLVLSDGDIVVLRSEQEICKDAFARVNEAMKGLIPNNKVILLDSGIDISIISQAELEEMDAGVQKEYHFEGAGTIEHIYPQKETNNGTE